ncbi:TFIIH Tfb subfamily [Nucleospora cyclopteri]
MYKIFAVGYAPCPQCKTQLRRINFMTSTFEDIQVERELKIRKMLHKTYSYIKNPENLMVYNDWLEEFENVVFELMDLSKDLFIRKRIEEIINDPYHKLNLYRSPSIILDKNIEEPAKKARIEKEIFGIVDLIKPEIKIIENLNLPKKLFRINRLVGMTESLIIQIALYDAKHLLNK